MTRDEMQRVALDPAQVRLRSDLADFSASVFHAVGRHLHVIGHIVGDDRQSGLSPFGHGDDETVGVSMLLRIAQELISASATLINDGRIYAACALIRQLVEVEYLTWAFEARDGESMRWLRSTNEERRQFFSPAKLRAAAEGRFRGADYGYHCELGGHPTPRSWILLNDASAVGQLMLSDALGHAERIWNHVTLWARGHVNGESVLDKDADMAFRFAQWRASDDLVNLPPPPDDL